MTYLNGNGKHQDTLDRLRKQPHGQNKHINAIKEIYALYLAAKYKCLTDWQRVRFINYFGERGLTDEQHLEGLLDRYVLEIAALVDEVAA